MIDSEFFTMCAMAELEEKAMSANQMTQDDEAAKELFEAKRQYHEAESALAVANARLSRAENVCRAIWTKRIRALDNGVQVMRPLG